MTILLILIFSLLLRIISLNQSFWLDEAIQAVISKQNLTAINWSADFQPPLYYTVAHLWMKWGITAEWFLRLPSVFFGACTVYLTYIFTKALFSKKTAIVAALLLASSGYHIYYSQEFRMYSFFTFLSLSSWYTLYKKNWQLYALCNALLFYTHYFSFLVIIAQTVYYFFSNRYGQKQYIFSNLAAFIPFVMWLPTFLKQLQTARLAAIQLPLWENVLGVSFWKFPALILAKFTVGVASPDNQLLYGFFVSLVGVIFLMSILSITHVPHCMFDDLLFKNDARPKKYPPNTKHFLLLSAFCIPLIIAWLASPFIKVNSPHRFVFLLPAFYMIIAVAFLEIKNHVGARVNSILLTIIICNVYFSLTYLFNPKYHREDWRRAVSYSDHKIENGGVILNKFIGPWAPQIWYSQKPDRYQGVSQSLPITDQSIYMLLSSNMQNTNHYILYTYLTDIIDPYRLVEKNLLKNGYVLNEEKDIRGVGIIKIFSR